MAPLERQNGGPVAEINWEVVNNGLDFLGSAVEHLAQDDPRALRYAALHLAASIETLLKARLSREHWTLVVADIRAARRDKYETGNFVSVGTEEAIKRLDHVANVTISIEDRERIQNLTKIRNQVAHFAHVDRNSLATQATVARAMDALIRFIERELAPGAPDDERVTIDSALVVVIEQIRLIDMMVRERMNSLKPEVAQAEFPVVTCPECEQDAYIFRDGQNGKCLFCGYDRDGAVAAIHYAENVLNESEYTTVKDGGEWIVHYCLNCGKMASVEGIMTVASVEANYGCFACGYYAGEEELERCERCGEWTHSSQEPDSASICSNCTDWMMAD
jgi:ssDNA-binding Zn-finger/Zn-ribbon topoisomerase 1